jgi:hypothetical protein
MYFFTTQDLYSTFGIIWNEIFTQTSPAIGLINYGQAITEKGKLVIYGGQKSESSSCFNKRRKFTRFNDLWLMDLSLEKLDFVLLKWIEYPGGISKIVLIEKELLCVFNGNFPNQMIMLDVQKMSSYEMILLPSRLYPNCIWNCRKWP